MTLPARSTRGKRSVELSAVDEELWSQLLKDTDKDDKDDPDFESADEDEEDEEIASDADTDNEEDDKDEEDDTGEKDSKKKSSKSYKDPKSIKSLKSAKKKLSSDEKSTMETELEKHLTTSTSTDTLATTPNKRKRKDSSPPQQHSEPTSPSLPTTRRSSQRTTAIEQLQKGVMQPTNSSRLKNKKLKVDDDDDDSNKSITGIDSATSNRTRRSTRTLMQVSPATPRSRKQTKKVDDEYSDIKVDTVALYGLTQKQLIEETKETEIYNTESLNYMLKQEEDKKKLHQVKKQLITGPRIIYTSNKNGSTVTFTDSILPDCLLSKPNDSSSQKKGGSGVNNTLDQRKKKRRSTGTSEEVNEKQEIDNITTNQPIDSSSVDSLLKKKIEYCVITGKPAKYIDPESKQPFANLEAYKIIKEKKRLEEQQKLEAKRRPNINLSSSSTPTHTSSHSTSHSTSHSSNTTDEKKRKKKSSSTHSSHNTTSTST